ncbi:MAG: hypothetical protein ACRDDY_02560 [Clostridium sp.]|uniref:hypothetical protein n=2 Tax=Clostridium TaxID=1485 RepID=UPI003EE6C331
MNKFAKLINNKLEYAPNTYVRPSDGRVIANFDKSEFFMRQEGFKEVLDVKPNYDYDTQYIYVSGYIENETSIVVNYTVGEIEKPQESLEEKVIRLEKENAGIKEEMAMTQAMVNDLIVNTFGGVE